MTYMLHWRSAIVKSDLKDSVENKVDISDAVVDAFPSTTNSSSVSADLGAQGAPAKLESSLSEPFPSPAPPA
jgi:hypothetical protein